MDNLERVNQALDQLADCGVIVLLSISPDDVQECADEQGITVSAEKARMIVSLIAKEWESGDEWQSITDRMADMLATE